MSRARACWLAGLTARGRYTLPTYLEKPGRGEATEKRQTQKHANEKNSNNNGRCRSPESTVSTTNNAQCTKCQLQQATMIMFVPDVD